MNPVPSPALVAAMLRDPDTLTLDVPATSVAMGCAQSYGYRQVKSGAWPSIRHGPR